MRAALRGVLLGEQHIFGDVVELGVAVVGVAIGVGQFHGFDGVMNVIGRVGLRAIVAFHDVQDFEHRGTLAPEAGLVNGVAVEGGGDGLLGLKLEGGHVFIAQQSAVGLAEGVDLAGDFAAIEIVADGVDGGFAGRAVRECFLFGLGHGAEGAGGVGLAEDFANLRRVAIGHEVRLGGGPKIEKFAAGGDGLGSHFIDGVTVGVFNGGGNGFLEGLGSVVAQGDQAGVHHAGHQRGHETGDGDNALQAGFAVLAADLDFTGLERTLAEHIGAGEFGHGADAGDGVNLAVLGANEDGRFAAQAEVRKLRDRSREHGGDANVHRVAAAIVHAHAGFGGVFTSGGHSAMSSPHGLAHGTLITRLRDARSREDNRQNCQSNLHEHRPCSHYNGSTPHLGFSTGTRGCIVTLRIAGPSPSRR